MREGGWQRVLCTSWVVGSGQAGPWPASCSAAAPLAYVFEIRQADYAAQAMAAALVVRRRGLCFQA